MKLERFFSAGSWRDYFRLVVGCSLLLHLLAAYRSQGFYRCDEHFQVIEYLSSKLFGTPADLGWQYTKQIRPWFQPAVYYPFAELLVACGVRDPFTLAWVFRSLSALLGWWSLAALGRWLPLWFADGRVRRGALLAMNFFYLVPMLDCRTSAENFSQAFVLLGLERLLSWNYGSPSESARELDILPRALDAKTWLAGVAFGFAFLSRYQVLAMIGGACLWFFVYGRGRLALTLGTAGGFLVVQGFGAVLDRWGYGQWAFPPWNYLRVNLMEGAAAGFGTLPVWGYVTLLTEYVVPPFGPLWIAVLAAALVLLPRHVLTWTVMPLVILHHAIAHKEARFLFPTLVLTLVLAALLVERIRMSFRSPSWSETLRRRLSRPMLALLALANTFGLYRFALSPPSSRWTLLEELDALAPAGFRIYSANGFEPIRACAAEATFYMGKRQWEPYRPDAPLLAVDARGLPVFYAWTGKLAELSRNPFARTCHEVATSWLPGPVLGNARLFSDLVAKTSVDALYRCDGDRRDRAP